MTRRRRTSTPLLLLAALAVPTALAADPGGVPHRDPAAVERLMAATHGKAKVHVDGATATASSVSIPPDASGATPGHDMAAMRGKSKGFLREHGRVVGVADADSQLRDAGESMDRLGQAHFKYEQVYQGVPVFGAVLKTHFDANGELRAVTGKAVPDVAVDPNPAVSTGAAGQTAVAEVRANPNRPAGPVSDDGLSSLVSPAITDVASRLLVYRTGLTQGVPGENHLAWEVEVGNGLDVREFVYVDAHTGKVIDRITGIYDSMFRRAYNGLNLNGIPPSYPGSPFWVEGNAFPTGIAEADNMLISSTETYDFFNRTFGRDSFDGHGAKMDQIFNRGYSCPNASWNGTFISFCPGLTTDDVTTHEWSHAYTQYTHGLIYQWQSGALNESYSDIWGETVDHINGRGTDVHGHRTDGLCSSFFLYPPVARVNSPAGIAGDFAAASASFGPAITGTGVTGDLALAVPVGACTALTNPADIAGKIAVVDRGVCAFTVKVKNAQLAGAIAVMVVDNVAGALAGMSGVDATITIPSLRVTLATGNVVKPLIPGGVNLTLRTVEPPVTDHIVSWMLGEDDTAPGLVGSLRDMWNPPCAGNPGKVSDPQYSCSTGDNGGVHNNSGVPNHAYALLVDGGTYNGHTNAGIGLTKAAHIYWRAQTVYQTPTTDFADHAFSVGQSCNDLIGAALTELGTGAPSSEVITAADCDQVSEVMAAVEMANPPVQCGFVPILNPTPPARCAAGNAELRVFQEDFESGPGSWTASRLAVSPTFTPRDWNWVQTLPSHRAGAAFFAPNPAIGLCTVASNESGVLHLDSPVISLPTGAITPLLTFDHWVATEPAFDGGNLKVSVNGGAWQLVAPAQYTWNPPNRTLNTAAQNNSDPLAGQPAFSGTNPGQVAGSWGRSHVDLTPYAHGGDSVQLRFDLGCDCGGGRFGWYLDDPVVAQCVSDAAPAVSIGDTSIAEGNDGFTTMTFTVSLSAPTTRTVTVHYKTSQGSGDTSTASNGTDYLPVNGDLTFAGSTLDIRQTVTVRIKGDTRREADEYFFVNLSSPGNATIGDGQGQGNILNDD